MGFQQKIVGSTSNNVAEVNASNEVKVALTQTAADAGFVAVAAENDAGTVTGARTMKALEVSENFRLRVGQDQLIFQDQFAIAQAYNINNWTSIVSTMTNVNTGGFLEINSGASVASGTYSQFKTWRQFPIIKQYTTQLEMNVQFAQLPQTNNVCEWGMFNVVTTGTPLDGVFFRLDASGVFTAVVNNNGVEIPSSALNFATLVGANTTKQFLIYMDANTAKFWINNVLVATIPIATAGNQLTSSMSHPITYNCRNSGVVGAAQKMRVGAMSLSVGDLGSLKPWADTMAGMGGSALQTPTAAGGQSSNYTNSMAAGAGAVMTNTTAAIGTSGLGGQYAVLPTLAAGTDGILLAYAISAPSATIAGKTLYITGVRIQGAVTTVLVGNATPVVYAYALAVGSSAVSLATTDAATAKAPRRMPLGYESYAAAAAVGTIGQGVSMTFNSPICAYSGEYVHIIAKNLGVVTTTGVITILVTIDGYWE